ncbi:fatty acid desaturase-domain-containing protein [Aspergillus crustosus]
MAAASQRDPGPKHIDFYGNVYEVPEFSKKQIYAAIPAHCFRPSTIRGLAYVVRDLALLSSLAWITYTFTSVLPSITLRTIAYTLYTVIAGMIMTGIWIIAHECGHDAFSPWRRINNLVGFVLHSLLLVPYYSWKITHSHHHKATGDLQRDTVYVPHSREYLTEDAPVVTLWHDLLLQIFGWPLYMLDNLRGQKGASGFPQESHYWFGADSALYKESELFSVFLSDLGVATTCVGFDFAARVFSLWTVLVFYGIPYLWLNQWVAKTEHSIITMKDSCYASVRKKPYLILSFTGSCGVETEVDEIR